jgi:tRNA1Val (adenine37-N6)-methyltransferase
MANSYFQFKQFTIQQDRCAMKVCTDACVFGAFVAEYLAPQKINNCLDIGTGTGLLSLMLAQKNDMSIDTVEINAEAYLQAKQNIENSIYKNKISIHNQNILGFDNNKKYDFIITNPPFYEGDLMSSQQNKNQAKHNESLTLPKLLQSIIRLFKDNGEFAVLLPYHRIIEFELLANDLNYFVQKEILLKQTPKHLYFRGIQIYSCTQLIKTTSDLIIKDENNLYTNSFVELLKDYYLDL